MKTQIELQDGPLAGVCHELQAGWPAPDRLSLPDHDVQHWYQVDEVADNEFKGYYLRTEPIPKIFSKSS